MILRKILRILVNRYVIATVAFLLIIFVFDPFNVKKQIALYKQNKALEADIQYYENSIEKYRDSLGMVTVSPEGMERIAREKYFMQRDDEVVIKIETHKE